jgi:hypothetical protein
MGKKVIEEVAKNIKSFFQESARAEKDDEKWDDKEDGSLGMVHVRNPLGGDYSSQVHDTNNGSGG